MPPLPQQPIAIVDDDASVRSGVGRLLRSAGYSVVEFPSAEAYLAAEDATEFLCLLLDVRMTGMDGRALQETLLEAGDPVPVIFLTGHGDIPMSVQAMRSGAEDFLTKPVDEDVLLAAVSRAAGAGERRREEKRETVDARRRLATLSGREREVLGCLLSGALNKQVGAHLGIAEKTVKVHRARVLAKMGFSSMTEIARICSLLEVPPESVE